MDQKKMKRKICITSPAGKREFEMDVEHGDTWRRLLGPECAQLIHCGSYRLLDGNGSALNLDSPATTESDEDSLHLQLRPRQTSRLWVDSWPQLRKRVVFLLAEDEQDLPPFQSMLRLLNSQGIAAAGFRSAEALQSALTCDLLQNNIEACGLLACPPSYQRLREVCASQLESDPAKAKVLLGYAHRTGGRASKDLMLEDLPWVVPIPDSMAPRDATEQACRRITAGLNYDFEHRVFVTDPKHGTVLQEQIRHKSEEWLKKAQDVKGAILDIGLTQFLWLWLRDFSGKGSFSGHYVNKIVSSIPELRRFRRTIGESLDAEDASQIFKKSTEIIETQIPWK